MNALATASTAIPASHPQATVSPNRLPRLRLLLVTDTAILNTGGSERFLRALLHGLDPQHYAIDVVQLTVPLQTTDATPTVVRRDGLRLEHMPIGPVWGARAWRVHLELRRRVLRGDYDIVQSQHEKADLLCALLPRGPGHAIRISNRRDCGFQKGVRLRSAFRVLNSRFDWIVAPSQAVLDRLQIDEGVLAERTLCLPNGVDTRRFTPATTLSRRRERLALGLDPDAFVFGCVARLVALKRHSDLIEAFALIATRHPEAQLVLVGAGPRESALREQVAKAALGTRVHFPGERRDIENLLPMLDAFVLCSSTEGMSNAVLEAMACGLPAIATAVGGNPELIDSGRTGLLVPSCEPARLATAMESLLLDRARTEAWGRQARQRAETSLSVEAMVGKYDQFYRTCRAVEALS